MKHEKVNELRVFYEIIAKADQLFDGGHFTVLNMETARRITVLAPEFSPPIYEQEMKVNNKIKSMGILSYGNCALTSVLYKDVLFPKEPISLRSCVDNQKCKRNILKYTVRILRRIQVFGDNKDKIENEKKTPIPNDKNKVKPLYFTDHTVYQQEIKSNCKKNQYEEQNFNFDLPEDIFMSEDEKKKFEAIPKFDKALTYGLSSSFSGKLFKVQYVV